MPGIVGLVTTRPREWAEQQLWQMVCVLQHDRSYVTGTWIDDELGVYVGWSVRRGSFADAMPLLSENKRVVMVFAGEEFPDQETRKALHAAGHEFDPSGPQYLVHWYEEDPGFPSALNGTFAGFVADRGSGTAVLFNDRYGLGRVYQYQRDDVFYFASEAKAILAVRPELRTLDIVGVGEYLSLGCVLHDRTLFRGLTLLPHASRWKFSSGRLTALERYFDPREWEKLPHLEEEAYYQLLRQTFSRNLERYLSGSESIGVSLTGGLDSRMIMAWQRAESGSLHCHSFSGMFRECQDVRVARRVARLCEQPHEVIPVSAEFLNRFADYASRAVFVSDGCADVSLCPDLYMYEEARRIAPVRLTGNFGGEVLRGIRAFKPVALPSELFAPELAESLSEAVETYRRAADVHPLSFVLFRQTPWYHYSVVALEQALLSPRTPYLDNDVVRTLYQAPPETLRTKEVSLRLISDGNAALRRIPTDRGSSGDAPWAILGRAVASFWFRAEYAYDYGMPRPLVRIDRLLSPLHLERFFLGRHKFYHFRLWYSGTLAGYVREILLSPQAAARHLVNRTKLESIVEAHLSRRENHTTALHKLLTLELIQRLFIDNPPRQPAA